MEEKLVNLVYMDKLGNIFDQGMVPSNDRRLKLVSSLEN